MVIPFIIPAAAAAIRLVAGWTARGAATAVAATAVEEVGGDVIETSIDRITEGAGEKIVDMISPKMVTGIATSATYAAQTASQNPELAQALAAAANPGKSIANNLLSATDKTSTPNTINSLVNSTNDVMTNNIVDNSIIADTANLASNSVQEITGAVGMLKLAGLASTALPLVLTAATVAGASWAAYNNIEAVERFVDNGLDAISIGDIKVGAGAVKVFFETQKGQNELTKALGDDGQMSLKEAMSCIKRNDELKDIDPSQLQDDVNIYAKKICPTKIEEYKQEYTNLVGNSARMVALDLGDIGSTICGNTPNVAQNTPKTTNETPIKR